MDGTRAMRDDLQVIDEYSRRMKSGLVREPEGIFGHPWITPGMTRSEGHSGNLIDWDAIWAGISYLIDGDSEPLLGSLLNILAFVDEKGKGYRVIGPDGPPRAGAFTNRPFVATGVFVLSRELGSTDWLPPETWQKVRSLLLYWHRYREGPSGLVKWLSVDEGFADNGLANWSWELNTVEGVDLNAQMVLEHSAAAWVADRLGRPEEASEHRTLARNLADQMQEALWNEESGAYCSRYLSTANPGRGSFIDRLHYTNLWPLWLGLAPTDRAKRIIETYVLSPDHFWSDHGIRSMSRSEPPYNNGQRGITVPYPSTSPDDVWPSKVPINCSNWQGPLWSLTNYLVAIGLWRYGYQKEAEEVTRRTVKVLADDVREHGYPVAFYENYDAETGKGLNRVNGMGSWSVMIRHLPDHIMGDETFLLRGLTIPGAA